MPSKQTNEVINLMSKLIDLNDRLSDQNRDLTEQERESVEELLMHLGNLSDRAGMEQAFRVCRFIIRSW